MIRRGWGWEGGGKNDIQFSDSSNWGEGAAQEQQQKYERFGKRKKTSVCDILTGRCPNKNVQKRILIYSPSPQERALELRLRFGYR